METITSYVDHYGYIVLFAALLLEMIALPVPGEILMSYTGFLVYQGHLNWLFAILSAGLGTTAGMTLSYWIGSLLGDGPLAKYGRKIHLGPEQLEKMSVWFNKYGNKVIVMAFYIPGIRHLTGYFSGITGLRFRIYAVYAYLGAFLWAGCFITIGKLLGPKWEQFHSSVTKYMFFAMVIIALGMAFVYIYRHYPKQLKAAAYRLILGIMAVFKTKIRTEFVIVGTAVITLSFIILMLQMVQYFLGNQFQDFNDVMNLMVPLVFGKHWNSPMEIFLQMGMKKSLMTVIILTLMWILWKGRDKTHEALTLFIVTMGGELYEETLRKYFHQVAADHFSPLDYVTGFPSDGSIMILVIYGFAVYMLVRHSGRIWIHTLADILLAAVLLFIGISHIYFGLQEPSDIAGGYVFGVVWLGLNILLLELLRLL